MVSLWSEKEETLPPHSYFSPYQAQTDSSLQRGGPQRRSFKKSLAKAFTRKKTPIQLSDQDQENTRHVIKSVLSPLVEMVYGINSFFIVA